MVEPTTDDGDAAAKRAAVITSARGAVLLPPETLDEEFRAPGPNPEEFVAKAQMKAIVGEMLDRLPPRQRDLLRSLYFGEQTLLEASAGVGVGESWGSRLHARALSAMGEELREQLPPSDVPSSSEGHPVPRC